MKKSMLSLAVLTLAVCVPAWAQETKENQDAKQTQDAKEKSTPTSKQVPAEVISLDKTMKTITIKTGPKDAAAGSTKTFVAKVDEKAVTLLETVKPGEKVTLTCLGDKDRECETVTNIKKAPASDSGKE